MPFESPVVIARGAKLFFVIIDFDIGFIPLVLQPNCTLYILYTVLIHYTAASAQSALDEALPALDLAKKALESLNKKDLAEVKTYATPPVMVEKVMLM